MLSKFVLLATLALASISHGQACLQGSAMGLGRCFEPLKAYSMGNVPEERMTSFCRDGAEAVGCMYRLFDDCPQLRVAMSGNVQVIEDNINGACADVQTEAPEIVVPETEAPEIVVLETEAPETDAPATDSNIISQCSPKDVRRMQRCAARLQKFMGRSTVKCGKVRRTMDCLEETTQRCSSMFDQAEMPLDLIREQLLQNCFETNELPEEATSGPQIGEVIEEGEDGEEEGEEEVEVCPADYVLRMQRCVEDLNTVMGRVSSGSADLAEICSALTSSFECLDDYKEACGNQPQAAQMFRMLNMDQMESQLTQICGHVGGAGIDEGSQAGNGPDEGDSDCPADYEQRVQTCVAPMQAMNPQLMDLEAVDDEVCSAANDAFDCLGGILDACRNNPQVQSFTTIFNLDAGRSMVNDVCTTGTLPPGPGVDADCPSDHTALLLACVEPLQNFQQNPSTNVQEMCRVANTGFECLDDIMTKCANQPDVNAMNNMLDFEYIRGMVGKQCAAINNGVDDTCHVADPAQELLNCNRQLQDAASSSASIQLRCRNIFESLDCFDRLIANCPNHPSVVTFTDVLDLNEVRGTITSACPSRK